MSTISTGGDAKARLHCCGVHHQSSDRPQGVTLLLSDDQTPPQFQVACYGTGDNPDSVISLYPAPELSFQEDRTLILADELARGANVTVLVPHFVGPDGTVQSIGQQGDEHAIQSGQKLYTEANKSALEQFLRHGMKVKFLGVFSVLPDTQRALDCIVKLDSRSEDVQETVPTLYLTQSSDVASHVIKEDPVLVKESSYTHSPIEILQGHKHGEHDHHNHGEEEYVMMMKEILYFFKKHLHDWS